MLYNKTNGLGYFGIGAGDGTFGSGRACCAGYDEWYVFENQPPVEDLECFVNWVGYRLYDPEFQWCTDRFWQQIEKIRPESYVADGTVFTVVTRNSVLFSRIISGLAAPS